MYSIVDIETTGQSFRQGKITEIAIYVHNGHRITGSFTSLVNPECHIPDYITRLTGIDDRMVEHAPKFYEIARTIVELTAGNIFVAHNVLFDYSFVKQEFKSLGYDFKRKTLCTVRLGRKYLPGHASYSLGNICRDLHIRIEGRHRAAGDALATVRLLEFIMKQRDRQELPGLQMKLF